MTALSQPRVPAAALPLGRRGVPDGERLVWLLLVLVVVGQRLALPFTSTNQIPLILPVAVVVVGWGLATRRLILEPVRAALFLVAVAGAALVLVVDAGRGLSPSLYSYLYLVATYLPVAATLAVAPGAFERILDRFVKLMAVLALVGIVQFLGQFVGLHHHDYPSSWLPARWLLQNYNTDSPLHYGSSTYRATAWLFLEPSFYSQFLAVGILAAVWRRRRDWALVAMLAALVMSVSGTGIAMLIGGLVTLWVSARRRLVRFLVGPLVVAAAVAFVSPLGAAFTRRLTEGGSAKTSSGQRFVLPYTLLLPHWAHSAASILFGLGPGSSDRLAHAALGGLLAPIIPKLLLDYGVIVGLLLLVFVLVCFGRGPAPPLTVALLLAYTVLNEALLQPVIVLTLWAMTGAWTRSGVPAAAALPPEEAAPIRPVGLRARGSAVLVPRLRPSPTASRLARVPHPEETTPLPR